jgi:glycerate 2-kinase
VLVLLSGGASSLLADVPGGCTLAEVQTVFDLLLKSGAKIQEMNTVRKHLSYIKGGQLAKIAQPAKVYTLVLSDVTGDDISTIASGPTVPDNTSFEDVYQILLRYHLWDRSPSSVKTFIERGIQKEIPDTPAEDAAFFKNTVTKIIGNNSLALEAAAAHAASLGYHPVIDNYSVQEEASVFARSIMEQCEKYKALKPVCIVSGGETTVQVHGAGKGGRNQHLALLTLHELLKRPDVSYHVTALCAGTDGTDGNTEVAGAMVNAADTADIALLESCLSDFNSYHYFRQTKGHIYTGPTQTNVMDIMILLID